MKKVDKRKTKLDPATLEKAAAYLDKVSDPAIQAVGLWLRRKARADVETRRAFDLARRSGLRVPEARRALAAMEQR